MARKKKQVGFFEKLFLGCLVGAIDGCTSRTTQTRYGGLKKSTRRKRGQAHYW